MKFNSKLKQHLKILLVEDDQDFRKEVRTLLGVYNDIEEAESKDSARALLASHSFDLVLLDKMLPDGNGLDMIPEIKAANPHTVVIVLTADQDLNLVHKCLEAGASDYLYKNDNVVPDLLVRIPMALSRAALEKESQQLADRLRESFRFEIIGRSAAAADLRKTVQSLRGTLTPVLISGETGTGKELIARRLHSVEEQPTRPFVALNCSAIAENLVESELFGHVRGAFSGAVQDQIGKFQLADGGDLFLDEISELPLHVQSKLLRVLQLGEVTPIGSKRTIQVSVRVIAASNKPIEDLIAKEKFREDLYFRLNVYEIEPKPLREHAEDIPDLAQFFITNSPCPRFTIADDALKALGRNPWPGNIRELKNTIERAVILARRRGSTLIEKQDIARTSGLSVPGTKGPQFPVPKAASDISPDAYQDYLKNAEREYIRSVLVMSAYSMSDAASRLGIGRTTLFRKMTDLGLHQKASAAPGLRTATPPAAEEATLGEMP